jgi:hypothetical protein
MKATNFIGGTFTGAHVGDGSGLTNVNASTVANNSINSTSILNGSVSLVDMANNSINSSKIIDGSINTVDIANNSITSGKILNGDVQNSDLANGSVSDSKISQVNANKIIGTLPSSTIPNNLSVNSISSSISTTQLQVYQPGTIEVQASTGITATQLINSVLKIRGAGGPVDMASGITQIATTGMVEGQMLILKGRSDLGSNTVIFNTGDGLVLSQGVSFIMNKDDVLILILVDGIWIEVSRTDN